MEAERMVEGDWETPVVYLQETWEREMGMDLAEGSLVLVANLEVALEETPSEDTVGRVQKEEALAEFVSAFRHSWASALVLEVSSGGKELVGCVCTDGLQMV